MLKLGAKRLDLPDEKWDDLLHEWIRLKFGWNIPRVAVCKHHVAPFRFVADMFFERVRHVVLFASRESGKTLNLGILFASLMTLVDGIDIGHTGAVQFQSGKCFEYVGANFDRAGIATPNRSAPLGKGGIYGLDNKSRIQIYTGTVAGCQSGHPHFTGFDEVRHSNDQVLEEWKSMVISPDFRVGQTLITSSRGAVGDLMDVVLERAEQERREVYAFCVFEVAQQCTEPNCRECEGYLSRDRAGEDHSFAEICGGKMRASRGFMKRQDILDKFVGMHLETFQAQWLCEAPEQFGAYFNFHEHIHCIDSTTTTWRPHKKGHLRWWDFGVSDPTSVLFVERAGEDLVVVDMFENGDGETPAMSAPEVMRISKQYGKVLEEWGDPDGMARSIVAEGTPAIIELNNMFGIDIVPIPGRYNTHATRRKVVEERLKPRGKGPHKGKPRFYVWTETEGGKQFAKNMQTVRRTQRDGVPYGEKPDLTPGSPSQRAYHSCSAATFGLVGEDLVG